MSTDDDSKQPTRSATSTPRASAPKTIRSPQRVAGVDPPDQEEDLDAPIAEDAPRGPEILVLNCADGIRTAVRSIPQGLDDNGHVTFDSRGTTHLLPGLNFVSAEAWEDTEYTTPAGKTARAPGLRTNLGLRIRAKEIRIVDPEDTADYIEAIGLTASRPVLARLLELEMSEHSGQKKKRRAKVLEAIELAMKSPIAEADSSRAYG